MASKLYLLKKTNYENLENYFRLNICFYLHKKLLPLNCVLAVCSSANVVANVLLIITIKE